MAKRQAFNFGAADKVLSRESRQGEKTTENSALEKELPAGESLVKSAIEKMEKPVQKAFHFKFVPRGKIVFHKENNYPMETVEKLAESILTFGLIHNLEARYEAESDTYMIESGEQRTRAIDFLIDKYENTEEKSGEAYENYLKNVRQYAIEGYPCNVKFPVRSDSGEGTEEERRLEEIYSEIRLIIANEVERGKDDGRSREKVMRLNELLNQRNTLLGNAQKVNVNQEIGKALGISERQVKKYKAASKLIPELQELFDKNNITVNEGANYAQLDEKEQYRLLTLIRAGEGKQQINALYEKIHSMRQDVASREREIEKLEREKQLALQTVRQLQEETAEIEEKIRQQVQKEHGNDGELEALQHQLKQMTDKLKESEQKRLDTEEVQRQKIQELEKKLQERETSAAQPVDSKMLRATLQIENKIKETENVLKELKEAYSSYQQLYRAGSGAKAPHLYEEEIQKILDIYL